MTATAEAHREAARAHYQEAEDSYQRCDTDGFLTQWAHGLMGRMENAQAAIEEDGGMSEFPALFDLEGNPVPAKLVSTQFGEAWGLLSDEDPRSPFKGWFNPSKARNEGTRIKNNAKKGYYEGSVKAPARAGTWAPPGTNGLGGAMTVQVQIYRTDGGYDKNAEVVDNGQ